VPPGPDPSRSEEEELELALRETAERLSRAIEMPDPDAGRHVRDVARISALLGARLGLDPDRVRLLRLAAPMHDVGKAGIPGGVLYAHGELTPSERQRMEAHTTVGHQILAGAESEVLAMAATIALTHHERFDGDGYPRGLSGEEIPLEGRIVAVAAVLDALLSGRPYRPALEAEAVRRLIVEERGAQFDPAVVDALLEDLDEAIALHG
jgi:HD-GYP domain-containing protein (c-di-GMP phosphodiesterase class II)